MTSLLLAGQELRHPLLGFILGFALVAAMMREGVPDEEIARALGMDADELLRFKQQVALPSLFLNQEYSAAWE